MLTRGVLPDDWFLRAEGIPLSKGPIRAMALGLLGPLSSARALDVGAGSGGMTVELARSGAQVVAVERHPEALQLVEENCRRAEVWERVVFIAGSAPEALNSSERFDAIFVGGHGKDLRKLLTVLMEMLAPSGRMLLTAILPDSAMEALNFLESTGAHPEAMQIFPAEGKLLGTSWMFAGLNPVYLVWADKERKI